MKSDHAIKLDTERKDFLIEKLKALKSSDPDLILSWISTLTLLEQLTLGVLYRTEKATSIKTTRNKLIYNTIRLSHQLKSWDLKSRLQFPVYFVPGEKKERLRAIAEDKSLGIGDQLKEAGKLLEFPSFRSIDNTIQKLLALGLVDKREETNDDRLKGLFFLSPYVRTSLNRVCKKR